MTDTPGNETTEKGVLNGNDTRKTISLKSEENFTPNLTEKTSTGYAWELSLSKGLSFSATTIRAHLLHII
jgi:predicted secreted protein